MNFQTGRENLHGAHKALTAQWKLLSEQWKDSRADEFEKAYISRLERELKASLSAIEELDSLFKNIQEDCC